MGLNVTRTLMGKEQNLYLKITGIEGNKKFTTVTAEYYWDRELSAYPNNRLESESFPMHFERDETGNPFAIAYSRLKEHLTAKGYTFEDVNPSDETELSTLAEEGVSDSE